MKEEIIEWGYETPSEDEPWAPFGDDDSRKEIFCPNCDVKIRLSSKFYTVKVYPKWFNNYVKITKKST